MRFFDWVDQMLIGADLQALIGNGNNQYEQNHATKGKDQERSDRAKASHKPSTAKKQRVAEGQEPVLAKMLGGVQTEQTQRNAPVDVVVKLGGKAHGIELKTFVDNKNDKITMHPDSRDRKEKDAKKQGMKLHTVLFDLRDKTGNAKQYSGHRLYYRQGVGAFRLHTMTPVKNADHLKQLMRG